MTGLAARECEPTKGKRLETRALDAIHDLREAAAQGCISKVSALHIAKLLEDALGEPYEANIIHGEYPHLSDVAYVLRDYGAAISFILREAGRFPASQRVTAGMGRGL